jgi:hypothetical protein
VRIALEGSRTRWPSPRSSGVAADRPIVRKKVKEARRSRSLQHCPPWLSGQTSQTGGSTLWTLPAASKVRKRGDGQRVAGRADPRLTEVRALAGFTRFEARTAASAARWTSGPESPSSIEPLTWLPTVESPGEGFFLLARRGASPHLGGRERRRRASKLFTRGFNYWQAQRGSKATATGLHPRAVPPLHSLSHLLITTQCLSSARYSAVSVRERIYAGTRRLWHTCCTHGVGFGGRGSLGGLVGGSPPRSLPRACAGEPGASAPTIPCAPRIVLTTTRRARIATWTERRATECLLISEPSIASAANDITWTGRS